jgi:hypothetical protein
VGGNARAIPFGTRHFLRIPFRTDQQISQQFSKDLPGRLRTDRPVPYAMCTGKEYYKKGVRSWSNAHTRSSSTHGQADSRSIIIIELPSIICFDFSRLLLCRGNSEARHQASSLITTTRARTRRKRSFPVAMALLTSAVASDPCWLALASCSEF